MPDLTDRLNESRLEFQKRWNADRPYEIFGRHRIAISCTCVDGGGPTHWAAIRNTREAIDEHLELEETLASLRDNAGSD